MDSFVCSPKSDEAQTLRSNPSIWQMVVVAESSVKRNADPLQFILSKLVRELRITGGSLFSWPLVAGIVWKLRRLSKGWQIRPHNSNIVEKFRSLDGGFILYQRGSFTKLTSLYKALVSDRNRVEYLGVQLPVNFNHSSCFFCNKRKIVNLCICLRGKVDTHVPWLVVWPSEISRFQWC